jgi:hypothetical protein
MTLDRLFKLSVVFLAAVVALALLLSIVAVILVNWGGDHAPDGDAQRVPVRAAPQPLTA